MIHSFADVDVKSRVTVLQLYLIKNRIQFLEIFLCLSLHLSQHQSQHC